MSGLYLVINIVLDIFWIAIVASIIMSWLIQFEVLNIRQRNVAQIWYGLQRVLEPIYRPLRKLLPPVGGLDFTPLIILVVVAIVRSVVPGQGLF